MTISKYKAVFPLHQNHLESIYVFIVPTLEAVTHWSEIGPKNLFLTSFPGDTDVQAGFQPAKIKLTGGAIKIPQRPSNSTKASLTFSGDADLMLHLINSHVTLQPSCDLFGSQVLPWGADVIPRYPPPIFSKWLSWYVFSLLFHFILQVGYMYFALK